LQLKGKRKRKEKKSAEGKEGEWVFWQNESSGNEGILKKWEKARRTQNKRLKNVTRPTGGKEWGRWGGVWPKGKKDLRGHDNFSQEDWNHWAKIN